VEELFSRCDLDNNGYVDIKEFSSEYLSTKQQLQAKEIELMKQIVEYHK
jgi:Ca2+-binding EF-hand superfamily protein